VERKWYQKKWRKCREVIVYERVCCGQKTGETKTKIHSYKEKEKEIEWRYETVVRERERQVEIIRFVGMQHDVVVAQKCIEQGYPASWEKVGHGWARANMGFWRGE